MNIIDKITIIVPTYNRSSILSACLASFIDQSYKEWELFVIDDDSKDGTQSVVKNFISDKRIIYIKNEKNLGMSASREKGLNLCKTSLFFVGEDDFILGKNCLEILVDTWKVVSKETNRVFHIAPSFINIATDKWDVAYMQLLKRPNANSKTKKQSAFNINIATGFPNMRYGDYFTETPLLPSAGLYDFNLLKKLGFSKDYTGKPIFHEDDDLHLRAKLSDLHLFYQPKAIAFHLRYPKGGERSYNLLLRQFYTLKNHFRFLVKFFGLKSLYMGPLFAVSHLLYPLEILMETTFSRFFIKPIETKKSNLSH